MMPDNAQTIAELKAEIEQLRDQLEYQTSRETQKNTKIEELLISIQQTRGWRVLKLWWLLHKILLKDRWIDRWGMHLLNKFENFVRRIFRKQPLLNNARVPYLNKLLMQPRITSSSQTVAIITFDSSVEGLVATYKSLSSQEYKQWKWYILADENFSQWQNHPQIQLLPANLNSQNLFEQITADTVLFMQNGDKLIPETLSLMVNALAQNSHANAVYSDFSYQVNGHQHACYLPDWSPELMFSYDILQYALLRASVWREIAPNTAFTLESLWYQHLRMNLSDAIHVPYILYHSQRQLNSKDMVDIQERVLTTYLSEVSGGTASTEIIGQHVYPIWLTKSSDLVSIIIPTRDNAGLLEKCLVSIQEYTEPDSYEIILVDSGSIDPATQRLYEQWIDGQKIQLIEYVGEKFNYSAANNLGVQYTNSDRFLFLNNDIEVRQNTWLPHLCQWLERDGVGIVGPKMLFSNGSLQHAGVVVGLSGLADHIYKGTGESESSLFCSPIWIRNCLAVTGACLLTTRQVFNKIEGFDEGYQLNFSDVDFCIKAYEAGYRCVYTPQVELIHHEGQTHSYRVPRHDYEQASRHWQYYLITGDPFYNPNLSYTRATPRQLRHLADNSYLTHLRMLSNFPEKEIITIPDDFR